MTSRLLKCIFYLSLIVLTHPHTTYAKNTALTVSPAIFEAVIKPGVASHHEITLTNDSMIPIPIKGIVSSFIASEDIKSIDKASFNAAAWIHLDPPDFILQPKERKIVKVKLESPDKIEPGGHYATIIFRPLFPKEAVSASTADSIAQVGVLTFLIAPGDIVEKLELSPINLDTWQNFGPLDFMLTITNKGNLHQTPSGTIWLDDMLGHRVAEIIIDPRTILPGTSRDYHLSIPNKFLLGRYKLSGQIIYGSEKDQLDIDPQTTWFIPLPLIIPALILCYLLLWLILVGRKRLHLAYRVLTGKAEVWDIKKLS